MKRFLFLSLGFVLAALLHPAYACGTCYGAADSSSTQALNMAILTLLGITGSVLVAFTSFFLYLRRRARRFLFSNIPYDGNGHGGLR